MASKKPVNSIGVVIDTSIVRTSGNFDAVHPDAIACRTVLEKFLQSQLTLILTDEIYLEWTKINLENNRVYMSKYAVLWLSKMNNLGKVRRITPIKRNEVIDCIKERLIPERISVIMKDIHLFEAALSSDNRILSFENACWSCFKELRGCTHYADRIFWVNAADTNSQVWIDSGAIEDEYWKN